MFRESKWTVCVLWMLASGAPCALAVEDETQLRADELIARRPTSIVGRSSGDQQASRFSGGVTPLVNSDDLNATVEESWLTVRPLYIADLFGNVLGGKNNNDAVEYRGLLGVALEADLTKVNFPLGGSLVLLGETGHGRGLTERHVGDIQVLSNIDADVFVQLSEFWWERDFGELRLKVGQQDANADFAFLNSSVSFINASFGMSPTIPMPTYPHPGLGMAAFRRFGHLKVSGAVLEGSPNGGRLRLADLEDGGIFLIGQVDVLGIPQHGVGLHFGTWLHTPDVMAIRDDRKFENNYGFYGGYECLLLGSHCGSCGGGIAAARGLFGFAQASWAPDNRSQVVGHLGLGVVLRGPTRHRVDDELGVGISSIEISSVYASYDRETVFELFYRAQLNERFVLQPDLQLVNHPGGVYPNALAIGVRAEFAW